MGDNILASGSVVDTAPIVDTNVAGTDEILGGVGNSAGVAMGKTDDKGKDILAFPALKIVRTIWDSFYPTLKGVSIKNLTANAGPSPAVRGQAGWAAWTNRSTEIWIRLDVEAQKEEFVAYACAVLSHEKIHVDQFAKGNGQRPATLEKMLEFESVAYPAGQSFLHHKLKDALLVLFSPKITDTIFSQAMKFYVATWATSEEVDDIIAAIRQLKAQPDTTAEKVYELARVSMENKDLLPPASDTLPATLPEPAYLKALYGY
jgi:hypothetical protein